MNTTSPSEVQKRARHRTHLTAYILSCLLVLAVATSIFLFQRYRHAVDTNPSTQQQQLLASIGHDIILPSGTPVVSTVIDKSKLTNPALADIVNNGDKILIYGQARRLIVYRPSVGKVVDMLNIEVGSGSEQYTTSKK